MEAWIAELIKTYKTFEELKRWAEKNRGEKREKGWARWADIELPPGKVEWLVSSWVQALGKRANDFWYIKNPNQSKRQKKDGLWIGLSWKPEHYEIADLKALVDLIDPSWDYAIIECKDDKYFILDSPNAPHDWIPQEF